MTKTISTLTSSGAGSTDIGDVIVSGGTLVEAGTASGTIISSGGTLILTSMSGAAAPLGVGTMILNGGTELIDSGGLDERTIVASGGTLIVSGGTTSGATIMTGGNASYYSGAETYHDFIAGSVNVTGATEIGDVVSAGGFLSLTESLSSETKIYGTELALGGSSIAETVASGGNFEALYETVSGQTVLAGGTAYFVADNDTVDLTVSSGGSLLLNSYGGNNSFTDLVVPSLMSVHSGQVFDISGHVIVAQGQTDTGDTISANVTASLAQRTYFESSTVLSGGVVDLVPNGLGAAGYEVGYADTIESGGVVNISGNGSNSYYLQSSTIEYGATVYVSGVLASDQQNIISGTVVIGSGAYSADSEIETGGSMVVESGGFAYFNQIPFAGGTLYLQVGGSADYPVTPNPSDIVAPILFNDGGYYSALAQTAPGFVLGSGQIEGVESGGSVTSQIIASGGLQGVLAGGITVSDTVQAGGQAYINDATMSDSVVQAGGTLNIYGAGVASVTQLAGSGFVYDGGTALSTMIQAGGQMVVEMSGLASASVILAGGTEIVSGGGSAVGLSVSSGGTLDIISGAIVSGFSASSGATVTVAQGVIANGAAVANAAILSGGVGYVLSGGTLSQLSVSPPAQSVIGAGVTVWLNASGSASELTIGSGARLNLSSGAAGDGLSISGGVLALSAGALVSGIAFNAAGGELILNSATDAAISLSPAFADETILLSNVVFAPGATAQNTGSSVVVTDGGSSVTLNISGLPASEGIYFAERAGHLAVIAACYAAGTRIATVDGDVAIERIVPGNAVRLARGGTAPVIWAGRRRMALRRHREPENVMPVRILAGAIAPGQPARDLIVSPRHALLVDGALFEAIGLVNGATIMQQHQVLEVIYHHLELPAHDVIIAEGQPAESYLDRGNRHMFEGESSLWLHPVPDQGPVDALPCLPVVRGGPALAAVRMRLIARALSMGFTEADAEAPDVLAGGRRLRPLRAGLYALPPGTPMVALRCGPFFAGETTSAVTDLRRLGTPLRSARLLCGAQIISIDLTAAGHRGLYAPAAGTVWTDGDAEIVLPPYRGAAMLQLSIAATVTRLRKVG